MNLLSIGMTMVDWARAQFALTAIYHWLFVPLTLGLAVIMGIMETMYYRTGNLEWKTTAKYWQRLFGINFAMGVATGLILEFEFGTNWSNYSYLVGDVFGAPLAIEGIVAFFMESTFVAVMFFGWRKVSKGFHLASTWLTGLGATLSAWWILVANSWMSYPVGQTFNPDHMRHEMTSFLDVAFSPVAVDKFVHTVLSAWVLGAVFVAGVSSWYILKRRDLMFAVRSLRVATLFGVLAIVLLMASGDHTAYTVARTQPMKLAAMEGLYRGGTDQGLTIVSAINPLRQPDYEQEDEAPWRLAMPYALSFLATRDVHGFVPGVRDILDGYTREDGTREPSFEEKRARGHRAVAGMRAYRYGKSMGIPAKMFGGTEQEMRDNIQYLGYGYTERRDQVVPYIPVCFWAFRVMVGGGCLFLFLFVALTYIMHWRSIFEARWIMYLAMACVPLAYVVSEAGWLVAEFGRQPWTIQDMLPTWVGVSDLHSGAVMTTFIIFLVLFTTMLVVEISIMCRAIQKGPDPTPEYDTDLYIDYDPLIPRQ